MILNFQFYSNNELYLQWIICDRGTICTTIRYEISNGGFPRICAHLFLCQFFWFLFYVLALAREFFEFIVLSRRIVVILKISKGQLVATANEYAQWLCKKCCLLTTVNVLIESCFLFVSNRSCVMWAYAQNRMAIIINTHKKTHHKWFIFYTEQTEETSPLPTIPDIRLNNSICIFALHLLEHFVLIANTFCFYQFFLLLSVDPKTKNVKITSTQVPSP